MRQPLITTTFTFTPKVAGIIIISIFIVPIQLSWVPLLLRDQLDWPLAYAVIEGARTLAAGFVESLTKERE